MKMVFKYKGLVEFILNKLRKGTSKILKTKYAEIVKKLIDIQNQLYMMWY